MASASRCFEYQPRPRLARRIAATTSGPKNWSKTQNSKKLTVSTRTHLKSRKIKHFKPGTINVQPRYFSVVLNILESHLLRALSLENSARVINDKGQTHLRYNLMDQNRVRVFKLKHKRTILQQVKSSQISASNLLQPLELRKMLSNTASWIFGGSSCNLRSRHGCPNKN